MRDALLSVFYLTVVLISAFWSDEPRGVAIVLFFVVVAVFSWDVRQYLRGRRTP